MLFFCLRYTRFCKRFLSGQFLRFFFSSFRTIAYQQIPMVFKCGSNKFISSLSLIPAAELVEIRIEIQIHNIQIIANDFNGSNSSRFRKSFVIV